jgi:hypothetical protein
MGVKRMKATLLCAGLLAAGAAVAAPMPPLGGGGRGRLSECVQIEEHEGTRCGKAPDATPQLVEPYALWGDDIESSGCSAEERASLLSSLEAACGLFNSGVLAARRGVSLQRFAQLGASCKEAGAEWDRYIGVQRELFVSSLRGGVSAILAKCPKTDRAAVPPSRPGAKKKAVAARRPALCFDGQPPAPGRVPGACTAKPALDANMGSLATDMMDASMRGCSKNEYDRKLMYVGAFAANFKASLAFYNVAGAHFLAAQGGVSCDETVAAYEGHAHNQLDLFKGVWLRDTALTASNCR